MSPLFDTYSFSESLLHPDSTLVFIACFSRHFSLVSAIIQCSIINRPVISFASVIASSLLVRHSIRSVISFTLFLLLASSIYFFQVFSLLVLLSSFLLSYPTWKTTLVSLCTCTSRDQFLCQIPPPS